MTIKIITGMAGGGKSTVLDSFEDMGYYCIDNMPPSLLVEFIHLYERMGLERKAMAFCMDLRLGVFFDEIPSTLSALKEEGHEVELIFVEADDGVLLNRFREVRRSHPMEEGGRTHEAIKKERVLLGELRKISDLVLDTSSLTTYQLKRRLSSLYGASGGFQVIIESFGLKYGPIREADFVFDLRFLPNPFYEEDLRQLSGHDKKVRDYVMAKEVSWETFRRISSLLELCAREFKESARDSIHIGLGCTGGQHRSVTFSLLLEEFFTDLGYKVLRQDREVQ